MKRHTQESFLSRSKALHGNKYDYSCVRYINNRTYVQIICPTHGKFLQTPGNHFGKGCFACAVDGRADSKRLKTEEIIRRFINTHNNCYDYSLFLSYRNMSQSIIIICRKHGPFSQRISNHLEGHGCLKCGVENNRAKLLKPIGVFIDQARNIHGNKYDYDDITYSGAKQKITIRCRVHGYFTQTAEKHILRGHGCPKCSLPGYSKKCIEWLDHTGEKSNSHIQHAENGGEYNIPGTKYFVDGYCIKTNTVYEFYGDIWHGNPKIFRPGDLCNPYKESTAMELLQTTLGREKKITSLGYNLVTIWENEWDDIRKR